MVATHLAKYWAEWYPATCFPLECFCEAPRLDDVILQPANTWSNLSFVIVGIVVLFGGYETPRKSQTTTSASVNYVSQFNLFCFIFGLANVCLGFMSGFYHASLTYVGQWCDVESMYLIVLCTCMYEFLRAGKIGPKVFIVLYLLLLLITGYVQYEFPLTRRYMFFALVLIFLIINHFLKPNIQTEINYVKIGVITFFISYVIWLVDLRRVVCWPLSYVQGHAIWHVLDAIVCYIIYLYYEQDCRLCIFF